MTRRFIGGLVLRRLPLHTRNPSDVAALHVLVDVTAICDLDRVREHRRVIDDHRCASMGGHPHSAGFGRRGYVETECGVQVIVFHDSDQGENR